MSLSHIADMIHQVQESEKEKLTLVASCHLDKIVTAYPSLQSHIGVECQPAYTGSRIKEIEAKISEHIEAIQIEKCDL